jgi:hypothetical protein
MNEGLMVGKNAPYFKITDILGNIIDLSEIIDNYS